MANHSCPGYSDVWRFCNNDLIFVMSTCRFLIRPGKGQGAAPGPLLSLCQTYGEQHPNNPLLRNRGHAITLCANPPRVLACKTTADRHRQQIYSFAKTDFHRHMNCQKGSCVLYLIIHRYRHHLINSLWPGNAIWRHRTGSIFTHLMFFLPDGTSHYINQCWLVIS